MAIFTSLAVATFLGVEATFFTAAAAFVLNAAVVAAASLGVGYAQRAIAGNRQQPSSANDFFGVQGTLAGGGDVPRFFPLGRSVTPGALAYANYWNGHGGVEGTPNAWFTQVIDVSHLPGCRLLKVWVDGELCTIDLDPGREHPYGNPLVEYRKDGEDHLFIKFYDGTQTVADPFLVSSVSSADRPYNATRVGVGVAYVIATSLVDDTLFNSFPTFKFELSGVPLYDPSKDTTAGGDGDQRHDDKSTWGGDGDDYPAVQIYNIKRGFYFNDIWVYGLQNTSGARLPAANWITQIEKCRATIAGEDGDEPTYRSGMQINVNAQPVNAIKQFLSACQGRVSSIGGFYKLHLGAPDSPSFSFTDDDIVSIEPQVYRPFFAISDSVNGIQARYPDPAQGWEYDTAPAYYRADLEAKDGNRRLMASPSFDAVPYPAQVQRLQKSAIEEGQRARGHTIVLPPWYWTVEPGDVGAWTSPRNGYVGKLFRTDVAIDKANLDNALSISEVDPADFDWNHAGDFKPVTSGPTVIPRPPAQGIKDWTAEAWTLPDDLGIGRRPAIRMSWDGDMPGVVGVQYEVRLASDLSDVTRGRTDQLAAGAIIVSQSLIPNAAYQARGQYLPSSPRDMLWSAWLDVTTPDVRLSIEEFDTALQNRVVEITDRLDDKIEELNQRVAKLLSKLGAEGWTDIKSVRSQLFATAGTASAEIDEVRTVAASATDAIATLSATVSATFGTVFSSVNTVSEAVATFDGYVAGQYAVTVNVNGYIVGTNLINGGAGLSAFVVMADKIQFAFPGVNGGAPVPFLTTGMVNGVPAIGARANFYLDGEITARMIAAGEITAIHLAANSVTADAIDSGSIETRHLTVNSVPLEVIVDGAAAAAALANITPLSNASAFTLMATVTLNVKNGRTLAIAQVRNAANGGVGLRIYVDGVGKTQYDWRPGDGTDLGYAPGSLITTDVETGLSNGNHTFQLYGYGKSLDAGTLYVVNNRR